MPQNSKLLHIYWIPFYNALCCLCLTQSHVVSLRILNCYECWRQQSWVPPCTLSISENSGGLWRISEIFFSNSSSELHHYTPACLSLCLSLFPCIKSKTLRAWYNRYVSWHGEGYEAVDVFRSCITTSPFGNSNCQRFYVKYCVIYTPAISYSLRSSHYRYTHIRLLTVNKRRSDVMVLADNFWYLEWYAVKNARGAGIHLFSKAINTKLWNAYVWPYVY
jgi:hypothetical protein